MSGLGYALSGDARHPAVLFLHGFMGSAADWRDVTATLNDQYRCLVVDLPGHGASLGLTYPEYTVEGTARALLGLLDGLGIERPTLVGYSMGGRLALYLALRHPERCAGLFLESASPGLEIAVERAARRRADEEKAKRLESGDFEGFLEDWYQQPLFASLARDEATLRRTMEARRRNDPGELARSLRGMGTGSMPSLWREIPGLLAPTLAVAGALDEKYAGISHRMGALSPRVRAAVVPDAGHNVHVEAREKYVELLLEISAEISRLAR